MSYRKPDFIFICDALGESYYYKPTETENRVISYCIRFNKLEKKINKDYNYEENLKNHIKINVNAIRVAEGRL